MQTALHHVSNREWRPDLETMMLALGFRGFRGLGGSGVQHFRFLGLWASGLRMKVLGFTGTC